MNAEYFRHFLHKNGVKVRSLAVPLNVTPQTVYNAVNNETKYFTMEEAFILKSHLRMTDHEFKEAFGDESWYRLYVSDITG